VAGGEFTYHLLHLIVIEWRQRDHAVMRADAPRRPKLRASGDQNKQRCPRTSFGKAAQKVERGRISPVEIFHYYHRWLSPRASHPPIRERRQLSASQFLWRQRQCAIRP
jgi:hypothetical protein